MKADSSDIVASFKQMSAKLSRVICPRAPLTLLSRSVSSRNSYRFVQSLHARFPVLWRQVRPPAVPMWSEPDRHERRKDVRGPARADEELLVARRAAHACRIGGDQQRWLLASSHGRREDGGHADAL